MLNASGICPGHLILHLFTKTVNHNPLISFNYFSGRLSKVARSALRSAHPQARGCRLRFIHARRLTLGRSRNSRRPVAQSLLAACVTAGMIAPWAPAMAMPTVTVSSQHSGNAFGSPNWSEKAKVTINGDTRITVRLES
jgi:hypothetical protein